jgi:hypothetical protein
MMLPKKTFYYRITDERSDSFDLYGGGEWLYTHDVNTITPVENVDLVICHYLLIDEISVVYSRGNAPDRILSKKDLALIMLSANLV